MIRFRSRVGIVLFFFLFLIHPLPASGEDSQGGADWSEEFTFDAGEFKKSPFEWGGFLQLNASHTRFHKGSSFYRLNFFDQDQDAGKSLAGISLQPDLTWQEGSFKAFASASLEGSASEGEWEDDFTLLEGYASWQATPKFSLSAGKTLLRWGKGYAFSPVAFVSRDKNPSDPDLALEGFWIVAADLVYSLPGTLKTLAFTGILLPVDGDVNEDFGQEEDLNWAGKIYLLWHDTDIDLMALSKGSRTSRYGADFSLNILSNLEVHGEWSLVSDSTRKVIAPDYSATVKTSDAQNYLLGIRYLTPAETTFIIEYYRNGQGYTEEETETFFVLVEDATQTQLGELRDLSAPYQKPNFMRDYLYIRASQKEPFGWLYLTPAITSILNIDDGSYNVIPEILYTGVTNLELRFRLNLLAGEEGTEYGEKLNRWKVEGRARYFF